MEPAETVHGDSSSVQATSASSLKTRHVLRPGTAGVLRGVYGHTTPAMHTNDYLPPLPHAHLVHAMFA